MEKFVHPRFRGGGELLCELTREIKFTERHELQAVLRADIHAASAENALTASGFGPFKDGVDPALKTTRRLLPGLLLGEARFDLGDACAPFERYNRYGQAGIFVVLLGHFVMIEYGDLYVLGLGLPL